MHDPNAVKIYTDGSAKPNPGNGGIGMVVEFPESLELENVELCKGYKLSTNNRMELRAVIVALEWLQAQTPIRKFTRALIITDSDYVFSNHSNVQYWKTNGWCNADGKPYENSDLWDLFLKQRQKTKVRHEILWNKGKENTILLRVDALAKQATAHPIEIDYGFNVGKFTATRTSSKKGALLFPAQGQEALIRVYKKSLYGKNENVIYKVSFDLYDKVSASYTLKYVAYTGKECIIMKRNNCYNASFNDSVTFPLILSATPIEYLK